MTNPERTANIDLNRFAATRERPRLWKPSHDEIIKELGRYPKVIRETRFNEDGLVETPQSLLVPAYVGSGLGFKPEGREQLNNEITLH